MEIYNPAQQVPYITAIDGSKVRIAVIDLPGWDMVTNYSCTIPHGLDTDEKNIIPLAIWVIDDTGLEWKNLAYLLTPSAGGLLEGCIMQCDDTNVYAVRRTGGYFASSFYDNDQISRGKLVLMVLS